MLGCVHQTSRTANRGRLLRQRLGRVCEDPTVDFVFVLMLGGHLLADAATTQNVVATCSGEAEFYALTKNASRALGAVAMAADMSKVVKTTCTCMWTPQRRSETSPYPSLVGARGATTIALFFLKKNLSQSRHMRAKFHWEVFKSQIPAPRTGRRTTDPSSTLF